MLNKYLFLGVIAAITGADIALMKKRIKKTSSNKRRY